MKLQKKVSAIAVSAALGAAMLPGQAQADAFAEALINITGFIISNGSGVAITAGDISVVSLNDNLKNIADLAGNPTTTNTSGSTTFAQTVDALQACQGTCPFGENDFTVKNPPPTTTTARSDSLLEGQPISGVPGTTTGVHAGTVAETSINSNTSGSSTSDMLLNSAFTFTATHNINGLDIDFNAAAFLLAWTALGTGPNTSAAADFKWELTLTTVDPTTQRTITLIDWAADGSTTTGTQTGLNVTAEACDLNDTTSAGPSQPQSPQVGVGLDATTATACSGAFSALSNVVLTAGTQYSLGIAQRVNTQAAEAPEPATLSLLGLALTGLGFIGWRRRRS